jgi:co-chaperonin GroES (HSP10)
MKPIGKYIIIKTITEELKAASGLMLSSEDANALRYKKGRVVQPGTDVSTIAADDEIFYDKNAGHKMIIEGEQYNVISERDVVVVL